MNVRVDTPSRERERRIPIWCYTMIGVTLVAVFVVGAFVHDGSAPAPATPKVENSTTQSGPTKIINGVPVGYDQTQDGAIAAESNYESAWFRAVRLPAEQRQVVLATFIAKDALDGMSQLATAANTLLSREAGDKLVSIQKPISARIITYTPDKATVGAWSIQITAGSAMEYAREDWSLSTVALVWENNDWKFLAISTTDNPPAPVPSTSSTAVKSSDAYDLLTNVSEFANVPLPR